MSARHGAVTAFILLLTYFAHPTIVFAGTTGSLSGTVTASDYGAPIADAVVTATSASQSTRTLTDFRGHYLFVSLAPDTYTISIVRDGYEPKTSTGVRVVADQLFTLDVKLKRILKTIAALQARATTDLVRPGTTSDVYSINAAVQSKAEPLNGGNNLESAYAGVSLTPGLYIPAYQGGPAQAVYIRGADFNQAGYEYDGVPINRAFDFFPANGLSSLGQQDLEVYTGGSPANANAPTLSGYINQVIRTGTYPGFGTLNASVGFPAFYHDLKAEAGEADPQRKFSYYVGALGYNEYVHYIDVNDGANLQLSYPGLSGVSAPFVYTTGTQGVYPACLSKTAPFGEVDIVDPYQLPGAAVPPGGDPGCIAFAPAYYMFGLPAWLTDREVVANVHAALPHKHNSGRDDIQLLFSGSTFGTTQLNSYDDFGANAGYGAQIGGICPIAGPNANCQQSPANPYGFGLVACSGSRYNCYSDTLTFPAGTAFGQPAAGLTAVPYFFPLGQPRAFGAPLPDSQRDTGMNDAYIVKLQYQKNIGTHAYVRLFGYSDYSDLNIVGANKVSSTSCWFTVPGAGCDTPDYELNSHSRGASLQFATQLGSKHLLSGSADYTDAKTERFNQLTVTRSPGALATNLVGSDGNCYAWKDGTIGGQSFTRGMRAPCLSNNFTGGITAGTYLAPTQTGPLQCGPGGSDAGTPGCANHAQWIVTIPGGTGLLNTVFPVFTTYSLQDEFRPNDKLLVNGGVRQENYVYNLAQANTADYVFWYNAARNELCYDPATGLPVNPQHPLNVPGIVALPFIGFDCSLSSQPNAVHPNTAGHYYTNVLDAPTVQSHIFSPRLGFTYTIDSNTVIRGSAGLYTQPALSAWVEYLDASAHDAALYNFTRFWAVGFNTPRHNLPTQRSANYDLSYEHRLNGTQISYKVTPFYRLTRDQYEQIPTFGSFLSSFAAGTQKSYGVEFQITAGDVTRDGISGQLSYTYTYATIQYQNTPLGRNAIDAVNGFITSYNALTRGGGGAPCYNFASIAPSNPNGVAPPADCSVQNGTIVMTAAGLAANDVINPYYLNAMQPILDRNASYPAVSAATFTSVPSGYNTYWSPNVFSGFLNYRHHRFSITPSFVISEGTAYGSPLAISGEDPRTCSQNQSAIPSAANPGLPNFMSCGQALVNGGTLAIPNPLTGKFDAIGQYQQPWELLTNVAATYDVTPRIELQFTAANVYNTCFGGSRTPWSAMFPANHIYCAYNNNGFYVSNFYNGTSPNDIAANGSLPFPFQLMPYGPLTIGQQPAQFTLTATVKL